MHTTFWKYLNCGWCVVVHSVLAWRWWLRCSISYHWIKSMKGLHLKGWTFEMRYSSWMLMRSVQLTKLGLEYTKLETCDMFFLMYSLYKFSLNTHGYLAFFHEIPLLWCDSQLNQNQLSRDNTIVNLHSNQLCRVFAFEEWQDDGSHYEMFMRCCTCLLLHYNLAMH